MKKWISLLMVCVLLCCSSVVVFADDNINEWYEVHEENLDEEWPWDTVYYPNTLYIMGVNTYITQVSSSKIGMRVEAICTQSMSNITTIFSLQKKINGVWKNVGSATVSGSNISRLSKTVASTGITPGTYRAKTVTAATHSSGYKESVTCYSTSITIK